MMSMIYYDEHLLVVLKSKNTYFEGKRIKEEKARIIDYKSLSNSKTVKWLATGKITLNILKIKQDPKMDFHPPQNLLYKQPLYQLSQNLF